MITESKLYEIREALVECQKQSYSSGQKKKYSGYLNTWFTVPYKVANWTVTKTKKNKDKYDCVVLDSFKHMFMFKLNKWYHYYELNHSEQKLTGYQQRQLLIERKQYSYSPYMYGCAFMFCTIFDNGQDGARLLWSTGDDDSGVDFIFPSSYIPEVKKFIYDNRKSTRFYGLLTEWIDEKRELGFQFY